jgi:hypothetical protein
MVNIEKLIAGFRDFKGNAPFDHCVVDDFLDGAVLGKVLEEFPPYDSDCWFIYKNKIENKRACSDWNAFPKITYRLFQTLNSPRFVSELSGLVGCQLYADFGLHGGGWHMHGPGGSLNPHLDYSLHPKMGLQRKLNLIIYVSPTYDESFGGHLGLWKTLSDAKFAGEPAIEIFPVQNRAVIFDTTQESWHGLSRKLEAPAGIYRRSLAVYYLCDPTDGVSSRGRALFAPRSDQALDKDVLELIEKRSDVERSKDVYRDDQNPI